MCCAGGALRLFRALTAARHRRRQVASAVAALKKHLAKEAAAKNGLFEDDDMFNLVRAAVEASAAARRLHSGMRPGRPCCRAGERAACAYVSLGAAGGGAEEDAAGGKAKAVPDVRGWARRAAAAALCRARCAASAREAADELLWIPLHKPLAALPDYPVLMPRGRAGARAAAPLCPRRRRLRSRAPHPQRRATHHLAD